VHCASRKPYPGVRSVNKEALELGQTVSGWLEGCWARMSVPAVPRSTQPSTLRGAVNEYQLSG